MIKGVHSGALLLFFAVHHPFLARKFSSLRGRQEGGWLVIGVANCYPRDPLATSSNLHHGWTGLGPATDLRGTATQPRSLRHAADCLPPCRQHRFPSSPLPLRAAAIHAAALSAFRRCRRPPSTLMPPPPAATRFESALALWACGGERVITGSRVCLHVGIVRIRHLK